VGSADRPPGPEESQPRRPLTSRDVAALLDRHGLAPAKHLGQHFVVDPNTVRKLVRDAGVASGELVCEVGAGLGSLTLGLREAGARVVAIETDAGMAAALVEVVGDDPHVQVVHADAMRVDLGKLVGFEPATLVANLPYNIATPLVLSALEGGVFSHLHVMVQREVGQRWVAPVGDTRYSGVSVKMAALAEPAMVAAVPRTVFWPSPHVDSVTVALHPRPWPYAVGKVALWEAVEAGFAQRRKRLRNALAGQGRTPATVEHALVAAGLAADARAEQLGVDAWAALASQL
jgi:16S rRNA (adenine1518-N6/adenine1519-N6)-dimethyltransferase